MKRTLKQKIMRLIGKTIGIMAGLLVLSLFIMFCCIVVIAITEILQHVFYDAAYGIYMFFNNIMHEYALYILGFVIFLTMLICIDATIQNNKK